MNESLKNLSRGWLIPFVVTVTTLLLAGIVFSTPDGVLVLFGRWDVMACSILAVMPFAVLATNCRRIEHRGLRLCTGLGCLVAAAVFIALVQSFHASGGMAVVTLALFRSAVAFLLMMAVVLACASVGAELRLPAFARRSWSTLVMLALFALLVPAAYVDAVADGIRIDLENSLKSRRFALAERQARTMLELTPGSNVNGITLAILLREVRQSVRHLNAEIHRPLQLGAPVAAIGRRITVLMHLDRLDDALRLLSPLARNPAFQPICLDYQGLCWQRKRQYTKSLAAYQAAVAYWEWQPVSDRKRSSLASAWKGIGFAARHLGRRTQEERAYRTLVELSPTAESHFLLAQCYSEHQKTKLAAEHAAIATQLDPKLQVQSESMLTLMSRDHFGCLQIP